MSTKLEEYLEKNDIDISFIDRYKEYGYEIKSDFEIVVNFLLLHIYKKPLNKSKLKNIRLNQQTFSELIRKRDKKCIIMGSIEDECEAAHIVEVRDNGNYDIENGFLLNSALHKTFDKYLWCINPDTLKIEVKSMHNGTIKNYEGDIITIIPSNKMREYLRLRYNKYLLKN